MRGHIEEARAASARAPACGTLVVFVTSRT